MDAIMGDDHGSWMRTWMTFMMDDGCAIIGDDHGYVCTCGKIMDG